MTDTSKLISFVNRNLKRFFIRDVENSCDGSKLFKVGSPFPTADGNFGTAPLPGCSRRAAHGSEQERIGLGEEAGGCKLPNLTV